MIRGQQTLQTVVMRLCLCAVVCLPALANAQANGNVLEQLNDSLKELTEKVSPAVVEIRATKHGKADEDDSASMVVKQRVSGSGVIVDSDGYIVTNSHVVGDAKHVRVFLYRARTNGSAARSQASLPGLGYDARVVGVDDELDIAVLKIAAERLPTIPLADYEDLRPGQLVVAIGSPMGAHYAVTVGVVSSVARLIDSDNTSVYIQTDAALNLGNSGGPLLDTRGKVVGINTLIMDGDRIGLAIPSDVVKYAYEQIRRSGRVRHGDVGLEVQDITPVMVEGLGLKTDEGVIVADVRQKSPAAQAGIRPRDVVLSVDGVRTQNFADFASRIFRKQPGDQVVLVLQRKSETFNALLSVIEKKPQSIPLTKTSDPERSHIERLGVYGVDVDQEVATSIPGLRQESGVLITGLAMSEEGSESQSQLEPGDIIHQCNAAPVHGIADLQAYIRKLPTGAPVVLHVERKRTMIFVSVELDR